MMLNEFCFRKVGRNVAEEYLEEVVQLPRLWRQMSVFALEFSIAFAI